MFIYIQIRVNGVPTTPYLFPVQSTLREILAMPGKIVRSPSSNPAYPAILVPEAINPERGISYAWQKRVPP